jgi:hypothetical protein
MDPSLVKTVLEQGAGAPVEPTMKAALSLVEKLTLHPEELSVLDIHRARETGLTDVAIEQVFYVATLWAIQGRLADAFGFRVYKEEVFLKGAPLVHRFGYRYPAFLWPRLWPRG